MQYLSLRFFFSVKLFILIPLRLHDGVYPEITGKSITGFSSEYEECWQYYDYPYYGESWLELVHLKEAGIFKWNLQRTKKFNTGTITNTVDQIVDMLEKKGYVHADYHYPPLSW